LKKKKFDLKALIDSAVIVLFCGIVFNISGIFLYHTNQAYFSEKVDNIVLDKMIPAFWNAEIDSSKSDETWYQGFIDDCNRSDMSLQDKSYCVRNKILPNFNYAPHDDYLTYEPEKTLSEGGICRDWTRLYAFIFDMLGVQYKKVHMESEGTGHIFLITYDDDLSYCIIDQTRIWCE
jgi:hypothetical protein